MTKTEANELKALLLDYHEAKHAREVARPDSSDENYHYLVRREIMAWGDIFYWIGANTEVGS